MKVILFISTLLAVIKANQFESIVEEVRNVGATWVPELPQRFSRVAQWKSLLGVRDPHVVPEGTMSKKMKDFDKILKVPERFIPQEKWPECNVTMSDVHDQSDCGSCWAVSTAGMFSDRRCTQIGGNTRYSAQDILACATFYPDDGCHGGSPYQAALFTQQQGIVTGGDFGTTGTGETCLPYSLYPCTHHNASGVRPCPSNEFPTPKCMKQCSDISYAKSYANDKTYSKSRPVYISGDVAAIQQELMTNGPLSATFTVYSDFPTYRSGVYKHVTGQALGGHAVEMMGWGTDPVGGDYWLIKNSWNKTWGEDGYFRIERGTDCCGIERTLVGVGFL